MVYRVYVEKRSGFRDAANALMRELRDILGIASLTSIRVINRYDVEGITQELFDQCVSCVFSEPQVDTVTYELPVDAFIGSGLRGCSHVFAVEYLPGQFDQRADSASECIQLITQGKRPLVRSATVYVLEGETLTPENISAIKRYLINPVEAREASQDVAETLAEEYPDPDSVEVLRGFCCLDSTALKEFLQTRGLAMDAADLAFCQDYFRAEGREPTIAEIKLIDTYWSDHCRHTTFGTELCDATFDDRHVQDAWNTYQEMRHSLGCDEKPVCLMDIATIGARYLKEKGILTDLDESDEINACTVKVKVDVDGKDEDWLYLFKNETHNHPTEIEPFGGAATCVGGAIRDPLSGRAYVYQAARITGAGDPCVPVSQTLPGKLPQRKLVTGAAQGYSSYGNQIGLATGEVHELYHPGYVAKRMEIGAVVGATPADHVRRETPAPGDVVILLGGRTGRDGIGGATGSSKAHNTGSLESCGAEVQKGNAPTERKIQRLFKRADACRMIKRCNDFGAGGVSVAVGELADGVLIDLDKVPKKYEGLDGTELALSESQERMAVALSAEDADVFIALAHEENLEATPIATVSADARVRMLWRGEPIVDISREFLASNGAAKQQVIHVDAPQALKHTRACLEGSLKQRLIDLLTDINVASNKGLAERFDSTIGAGSVLMPFGGTYQLTPSCAMVAKLPVEGETSTCSALSWGFNPYVSETDPYVGSYVAVLESVAKLYAAGFSASEGRNIYLTFQEYFEKLRTDPARWGKPTAALLGALMAQIDLESGAIGGKDSMSGSFEDLDVPPTLVSFATSVGPVGTVVSPEFKQAGSRVIRISPYYQEGVEGFIPDAGSMRAVLAFVGYLSTHGLVCAIATPGYGGMAEALFKMCVGNRIGFICSGCTAAGQADAANTQTSKLRPLTDYANLGSQKEENKAPGCADVDNLFAPAYGSFIVELTDSCAGQWETICADISKEYGSFIAEEFGVTQKAYEFVFGDETLHLAELQDIWEGALEGVFPYRHIPDARQDESLVETITSVGHLSKIHNGFIAKPRVVIPVFPGTNCEYDTARAFERAGATPRVLVVNNLSPEAVSQSAQALAQAIKTSQIIMIPGGFSGGDEPDGSAKFITAFFRSPQVTEAVRELLQVRDGLILGICNGFQALVKLGLIPFGDIRAMDETCPTLTFNTIGRHQSMLIRTRVASDLSPWLSRCSVGDIHTMPISNGEGRFVADNALLSELAAAGQIATQYVDEEGMPSMDLCVNPSGSQWAIEGMTSPDGRIFGKMGHTERSGDTLYRNVPETPYQPIFEGGVDYFTG